MTPDGESDDTEFPGTLIVQLSSCVSRGDDESGKRVQNVLNGLKIFKMSRISGGKNDDQRGYCKDRK